MHDEKKPRKRGRPAHLPEPTKVFSVRLPLSLHSKAKRYKTACRRGLIEWLKKEDPPKEKKTSG